MDVSRPGCLGSPSPLFPELLSSLVGEGERAPLGSLVPEWRGLVAIPALAAGLWTVQVEDPGRGNLSRNK